MLLLANPLSHADGGWTRVKAGFGQEGLVPTAYLEELPASVFSDPPRPSSPHSSIETTSTTNEAAQSRKKQGPVVAPRRGAKKVRYVEAIYAYTAQSDAEFDMEEGERFILVNRDTGDGWCEVEKGGETKSVPANYVEDT